jgi:carbamoyl-phosphate synthase small subunit
LNAIDGTRATLALEDGSCFRGVACGAEGLAVGEVVFNTSMTGYQEILTDPSYTGQIVTMTCPQIGNYGTSGDDCESEEPKAAGFIVRELSPIASNWRSTATLADYLVRHAVVAIGGLDTRALTRKLRSAGVMRGVIATGPHDPDALVARARALPSMEGADLVRDVTCRAPFDFEPTGAAGPLVAAYDFGMKTNILRRLTAHGCRVRVFPAATPAAAVLAHQPAGVFLSNGPGDPAALDWAVANVRGILDAGVSTFGICLGHQLLALALGARTFKLKFGHRGANHPVKHLETGRVEVTSQNHGFAVEPESLPDLVAVTHRSLYDGTIEGFRHVERPVFCVQYHPEASPGPHDADYLFARFAATLGAGV